ncbi:hypothetical protein QQG55_34665 [Brugia pahangi]
MDKRETILTTTVVVLVGVGRDVDVTWCDVISFLLLEEILWNVLGEKKTLSAKTIEYMIMCLDTETHCYNVFTTLTYTLILYLTHLLNKD